MKLKICTEADYLQAHLTAIEGESRGRNPTLHSLKQRVTPVLKKWLLAANAAWVKLGGVGHFTSRKIAA